MRIAVLSPHFDDSALFAGGWISTARKSGHEVVMVTVFAGEPPDGDFSQLALDFHADCGLGPDAVATRRSEDQPAAHVLDVETIGLDFPDAVYRRQGAGHMYRSRTELFGPVTSSDTDFIHKISKSLIHCLTSCDLVMGPLSVGGHVDHRLTRQATSLAVGRLTACLPVWYEESLYAAQLGPAAWADVETAGLCPAGNALGAESLARKERAVACHESQMRMWCPAGRAEALAWRYALRKERIWSHKGASRIVWHTTGLRL